MNSDRDNLGAQTKENRKCFVADQCLFVEDSLVKEWIKPNLESQVQPNANSKDYR